MGTVKCGRAVRYRTRNDMKHGGSQKGDKTNQQTKRERQNLTQDKTKQDKMDLQNKTGNKLDRRQGRQGQ